MNRIAFKILAFNLLLVFLPIGSYMFLDIYEEQLLRSLEHALVHQGRLIAAALSGSPDLSKESAERFLGRMGRAHTARFRILDENGDLLADSSIIPGINIQNKEQEEPVISTPEEKYTRDSIMYQIASTPVRMFRRFFLPPVPAEEAPIYPENLKEGPEVQSALQGKYGSFTRISSGGQISVTLYSALPILYESSIIGVAVVSQSTFRILQDLYEVRLSLFNIFLYSIAAAGLLTIISAITISFPLNRLREEALIGLAPTQKNAITYSYVNRSDEIGDLARSLTRLSTEVRDHVQYIESFASDVSHEFKNPLASIRAAVDMAKIAKNEKDRDRFLTVITSETESLKALLTGLRELSRLDMKDEELPKELISVSETAKNVYTRLGRPQNLNIEISDSEKEIYIEEILLEQVFFNLFSNSSDFSPADSAIRLKLEFIKDKEDKLKICISDSGPGFDTDSIEKVFDRFYSYRPAQYSREEQDDIDETESHSGLGLAIVKSIVHYWRGTIIARNKTDDNKKITGAYIEITIPVSAA